MAASDEIGVRDAPIPEATCILDPPRWFIRNASREVHSTLRTSQAPKYVVPSISNMVRTGMQELNPNELKAAHDEGRAGQDPATGE